MCSKGNIVSVNLACENLTGTISPTFSNLADLRDMYLNENLLVDQYRKA